MWHLVVILAKNATYDVAKLDSVESSSLEAADTQELEPSRTIRTLCCLCVNS